MSATLTLLHKSSGEMRHVWFRFSFMSFSGLPIEIHNLDTNTVYYYYSFEKLAEEWEFPAEEIDET